VGVENIPAFQDRRVIRVVPSFNLLQPPGILKGAERNEIPDCSG